VIAGLLPGVVGPRIPVRVGAIRPFYSFAMSGFLNSGTLALAIIMLAGVGSGFCDSKRSHLQSSYSLKRAKQQASRLHRERPSIKTLSLELATGGLTPKKLQGATSSIPPSQLGALFYGVALELEKLEGKSSQTALGYYMAALTDPLGQHYQDAKRRIRELVLREGLSAEEATGLYDGAIATFKELFRSEIGITRDGARRGLCDLSEIKAAYRAKAIDASNQP